MTRHDTTEKVARTTKTEFEIAERFGTIIEFTSLPTLYIICDEYFVSEPLRSEQSKFSEISRHVL